MDGRARARIGTAAEVAAAEFLVSLGMRLVEADVRFRCGQVDLVMADGGWLVLVEVKARRNAGFGLPQEAVGPDKLRRLRRLAETYRALHPILAVDTRVDVVAVDLGPGGIPVRCHHIPDVLA